MTRQWLVERERGFTHGTDSLATSNQPRQRPISLDSWATSGRGVSTRKSPPAYLRSAPSRNQPSAASTSLKSMRLCGGTSDLSTVMKPGQARRRGLRLRVTAVIWLGRMRVSCCAEPGQSAEARSSDQSHQSPAIDNSAASEEHGNDWVTPGGGAQMTVARPLGLARMYMSLYITEVPGAWPERGIRSRRHVRISPV